MSISFNPIPPSTYDITTPARPPFQELTPYSIESCSPTLYAQIPSPTPVILRPLSLIDYVAQSCIENSISPKTPFLTFVNKGKIKQYFIDTEYPADYFIKILFLKYQQSSYITYLPSCYSRTTTKPRNFLNNFKLRISQFCPISLQSQINSHSTQYTEPCFAHSSELMQSILSKCHNPFEFIVLAAPPNYFLIFDIDTQSSKITFRSHLSPLIHEVSIDTFTNFLTDDPDIECYTLTYHFPKNPPLSFSIGPIRTPRMLSTATLPHLTETIPPELPPRPINPLPL
ncbi:MAG TPA: hypothetical protein P5048_01250 [Chlamydiales bacterium]|nr:hypothetical protein [Chlamydiales bacterium]